MSNLTLEQIEEYIEQVKPLTKTEISCGNSKLNIRTNLSINETQEFINSVVDAVFADQINPSYLNLDVAFITYFLDRFTDFPIPTITVEDKFMIDSEKTYSIAVALNLVNNIMMLPIAVQLKEYIDKQIEFKNKKLIAYAGIANANEDAINTFSEVMYKGIDLLNMAISQLEKNGNKLFKVLTTKKINGFINGLQKTIVDSLKLNENSNDNKVVSFENIISKTQEESK